jgi:hypothetical protein
MSSWRTWCQIECDATYQEECKAKHYGCSSFADAKLLEPTPSCSPCKDASKEERDTTTHISSTQTGLSEKVLHLSTDDKPQKTCAIASRLLINDGAEAGVRNNARHYGTQEGQVREVRESPHPESLVRVVGRPIRRLSGKVAWMSGGQGQVLHRKRWVTLRNCYRTLAVHVRTICRVDQENPNEVDEVVGDPDEAHPKADLHVRQKTLRNALAFVLRLSCPERKYDHPGGWEDSKHEMT